MRMLLLNFLTLFVFASCNESSNTSTVVDNSPSSSGLDDWQLDTSQGWAKLTSRSSEASTYFAQAIAIGDFNNDGEMDLAAGAYGADSSNEGSAQTSSGGVYIYNSITAGGTPRGVADKFIKPTSNNNSYFGYGIHAADINNDNITDLIVTAPYDDEVGANTGAVHIYYGSSSGISDSPNQILTLASPVVNSGFGGGVVAKDLDGDGHKELIVGSPYDDSNGAESGSVWIFTGQPNGIYDNSTAINIFDSTVSANDYCGYSVWTSDFNGDGKQDIYMGCPYEDTSFTNAGKVWIWYGTGVSGAWVANVTAPDTSISNPLPAQSDLFGTSIVTMDHNNDGAEDLLIGLASGDDGGNSSGSVYIFNNIQSNQAVDQVISPPFTFTNTAYYGQGMSIGDIDGDGYNDLAVGSPHDYYNGYFSGRISILLADGITGKHSFSTENYLIYYDYHLYPTKRRNTSNNYFGSAICHMDFNKDGYDDLVVGAYHDDSTYSEAGAVFVYYYNSDNSISLIPDIIIKAPGAIYSSGEFGRSCLVMDWNRDGFDDLLIGAWQNDSVAANAGAVHIFEGSSTGTSTTAGTTFYGPATTNYYFGSSLAKGDIDNDGYDDLIVGAEGDDSSNTNQGALYVYRSDSTTGIPNLSTYTTFTTTGGATGDFLGSSTLTYDVDGDGDQDLLAGAYGDDTDASGCGIVHVWINGTNGSNSGANALLDIVNDSTIPSPFIVTNQGFGMSLAKGNYKSSSYQDLFIGAPLNDIRGRDSGALYIFSGTSTGYSNIAETLYSFDSTAIDAYEWFGFAFDIFDINGDGVADHFIGAPVDDDPGNNAGTVFIDFK